MGSAIEKNKRIALRKVNKTDELKTVSIPYGEDMLNITYSRAKYTPQFEKELKELQKDELIGSILAEMLYTLVVDWNIEDCVNPEAKTEEEQQWYKVPLVRETFTAALNIEALSDLMTAITEANRPN